MSTRVRCNCDGCGEEMPAEKLRPVFTVQKVTVGSSAWEQFAAAVGSDQGQAQWRPLKIGDACQDCLAEITQRMSHKLQELDGGVVDRILGGLDLGA